MKTDDKYSRDNGYICEYDNYSISPYDETLTSEGRAQKLKEVNLELEKLHAMAKSGLFD